MKIAPTQYRISARDPLRNFQFTISLDDIPGVVCGVQRISGLTATVTPVETWEGGNNLHRYTNPDKVNWEPVTLEQGIALDDTLEIWAQSVQYFVMTGQRKPGGIAVKRNVTIDFWSMKSIDTPARTYHLYNAWISRYNAMPRLDALASEVALLTVELVHEGFSVTLGATKDSSVTQPPTPLTS